ncbi:MULTISPECIES: hypothetical protein [Marinovum]|uniref:hypothetical protein n=1 Tax=Marinovum TaxID=367771 RepID=UPI00237B4962|nr:hypothetical protein [Marinovum sp. PR37]MDD9745519.1 hypothetical protein [Marinovum sp. PR37]
MFTERLYKPSICEAASEINSVTLRSWHRKGFTAPMGFSADAGHKLYSFHDMCVLRTASEFLSLGIPMPEALHSSMQFSDSILEMIEAQDPSGLAENFGLGVSIQVHRHWRGFGVRYRLSKDNQKFEFHDRLDGGRIAAVFHGWASRGAVIVDIGRAAQDAAERLLEEIGGE